MKKIVIVGNDDNGLYLFRKDLIIELTKLYDVYIVVPIKERERDFLSLGVTVIPVAMERRGKNPFKDYLLYRKYLKILKRIKLDLVLTYTIKPNIYCGFAAKKIKIPYIANVTGLGSAVESKGMLQKITMFLYKKAFKSVHTVFFQNQENMQFFNNRFLGIHKSKLIPGSGVNLNDFKLLSYPIEKPIKFVFIARIMKEKGIEYYLRLSRDIKKEYPEIEFHICGALEEAYQNSIKKHVEDGYIIYHGQVKNVSEILKEISCTIHPSFYPEGMSNVLLESAASGRPVITFNRSGCREIVENNVSGYLVEVHDYEKLLNKTIEFIRLSYREKVKMGKKGREKVELEFDRKLVVQSYLEVANQILK